MRARRVQNEVPEGRKSSPGGLRKPPRPKRRFGSLPRRLLERLRAPKKNFGCAQERLREISGSLFTLSRAPRGSPRRSWRSYRGSFGAYFWRSVLKMLKSQILQTVHTKTSILRVPEVSGASFFTPKSLLGAFPRLLASCLALRSAQDASKSALGSVPEGKKKLWSRPRASWENFRLV